MRNKKNWSVLFGILIFCLILAGGYHLPFVHDHLAWRLEDLRLRVAYWLNPPARGIFVPAQKALMPPQVIRITASAPDVPTQPAVLEATPEQTEMPLLSPTPSPTPIPLPSRVALKGVVYQNQTGHNNYCAPANLAMALSFWGWKGTQEDVGPIIKPNKLDKNVMPYEMVDYVLNQTNLRAIERVGGDNDLIRHFLAAGFPVLVEKGLVWHDVTGVVSWMGHYLVITGYDDTGGYFLSQDSLIGEDQKVPYDTMTQNWRAFNYLYIIIYKPEQEDQVLALLGSDADETSNFQNAALKAANEIYGLSGIDQYFAWFNRGSNLVALQDYGGAASAYDQAFGVYPDIPEKDRPWRMLWYQTGPYFAYYGVQRYYDLLYLADNTLKAMQGEKNLEESYYWRGMARAALGETVTAIEDFRLSLEYHPDFSPAIYQLKLLGVENP